MPRRNSLSAKFALISLLGLGAAFGCSSSNDAPSGFPPEATGTTDEADTAGSCGQATVSAGQTVTYSTPQSLKIPASLPGTAGASSSIANLVFAVGSSTTSCSYQSDGAPTPTLNLKTCSGGQQANTIVDVSGIGLCVTNFCAGGGWCPVPCATTSATLLLSADDGNPCTTDTCTYVPPPSRCLSCRGSYVPTHTAGPAGVACPDSNLCNGTEVCGSTGTCLANSGVPISLNNSNPCVSEKCDPTFGVVDTPITTGSCAPSLTPPSPGTVPGNITNQGWPNASQTGICTTCPDAIDQKRIAVIRGRVVDGGGNVVVGATVTIVNHAGFGQTTTRSDGWFDIAVNGGAEYTVAINAANYLPVQRNAATRWLDYTVLQETKLTQPAPAMTVLGTGAPQVTLGPSQPFQTVIGTTSTDSNGSRTPVLMFPAGTTASWSGQTTTNPIHVHATEFTVGPAAAPTNGANPRSVLSAMPGDLPRTSVYTYSVEFSVDEAGGAPVSFSNPVIEYVENFVGFDMNQNGGVVPNGYYDRARGTWVPLANGQIVQITRSDGNGHAVLASNGALNPPASSDELAALWNIYGTRPMPVSLWRVPLATTPGSAAPSSLTIGGGGGAPAPTAPFDQNWGMGCDPQTSGCVGPNLPNPDAKDPVDDPCKHSGSIIECENQILAEEIGIAGTPFFLRYQSERQKGRSVSLDIPVTPSDMTKMPKGVIGIFTDVYVAGTSWRDFQTQPLSGWQPNQLVHWTWDRINGYGQYVSGRQLAHVGIGYVYAAAYGATGSFGGEPGGSTGGTITGNRTLAQIAYWQYHDVEIGEFDAKGLGFGGWSISANHVYDTVTRTFYGGDGDRRRGRYQVPTISTVATGIDSSGVAAAPDGSFYTTNGSQIVHVLPSGSQELIATPASNVGTRLPVVEAFLRRMRSFWPT